MTITLLEPGKMRTLCYETASNRAITSFGEGVRIHMQTNWADKEHGLWYGTETRTDTMGRLWYRSLEKYVCDNFGDLVEAP